MRVVHRAHWPVLVVRGNEKDWPPPRVVVGFDYSPEAHRAALLGATIAGLYHNVAVTLLEATPQDASGEANASSGNSLAVEGEQLAQQAELLAPLAHHPLDVVVVVDEPAKALLQSQEADRSALIAVGTRGLGRMQRFRLGSVSTAVLHQGSGSVLVVPGSAAQQTRDANAA